MADEEKNERMRRLGDALEDVLVDGDQFQVVATGDEVQVTETRSSQLRDKHPRLYGRLLSLNHQMESGCTVTMLGFTGAAALCFALNVGWLDEVLGPAVAEKLDSWWFFVLLFLVVFTLTGSYYDWIEKRAYRRGRDELLFLMHEAQYDRDSLLVHIKDDPAMDKIAKQMMLDAEPTLPRG